MLSFSTKAETLEKLRGHLTTAQIKPLQIFTVGEWQDNSVLSWMNLVLSMRQKTASSGSTMRSSF